MGLPHNVLERLFRDVHAELTSFFGRRWYYVIPTLIFIILAPAFWYGSQLAFDCARFTEEWIKILVSSTFVYVIVNALARKHAFEVLIRQRLLILDVYYIGPLKTFTSLLPDKPASPPGNAPVLSEPAMQALLESWRILRLRVAVDQARVGADWFFDMEVARHLEDCDFAKCSRLVQQLFEQSDSNALDVHALAQLRTLTGDLLRRLIASKVKIRYSLGYCSAEQPGSG